MTRPAIDDANAFEHRLGTVQSVGGGHARHLEDLGQLPADA